VFLGLKGYDKTNKQSSSISSSSSLLFDTTGYNPYFEAQGIKYLQLPIRDRAGESLFDAFANSNAFVKANRDGRRQAVLIHCFGAQI
jgi:protein-tyrosine phosphatase